MATVQKTTMKRFNGTDWDPIHLATSGDITQVGETWQVMGQDIGAYKVGDTISLTDSITQILKSLTQTRIPATYTAPAIAFDVTTGSKAGSYEAGTQLSATLRATFTKNDAGNLTVLDIANGGTSVASGAATPQTYDYAAQLGDTAVTFTAKATYEEGEIKNDNLGSPSPTGHIAAGSIQKTLTYTPFRKYFYGADSAGVAEALTTSAEVRALTNSTARAAKGTKFSIGVPVGSTRCTIAFDKTVGTLAQVLYRESGNANITGQFKLSEVEVEGAAGHTAKAYNVYTITWAQPTAGAMTFDVTI